MSKSFHLEQDTIKNKYYRNVLWTTDEMQLVLMSLQPGEDIPEEIHHDTTQFIKIEDGIATIEVNGIKNIYGPGDAVIISHGAVHHVINSGDTPLKLYTLYSPPEHQHGLKEF